jgi:RNA polymerase sigma-70 factor (ECF subfamily)
MEWEPLWKAAVARWPGVRLELARFIEHLEPRAKHGLDRLHTADLYLAVSCLDRRPGALEAFERECLEPLPRQLSAYGLSAGAAEELLQALRLKLLVEAPPRLAAYDGRGPLGAWVRVAAVRLAANLRRTEAQQEGVAREAVPRAEPIDPELALLTQSSRALLQSAVDAALTTLSPEERMAFRLTYSHGVNLDGVAQAMGVSRATAGRRVLAARERMRDEVLRVLGERVPRPAELESLVNLVRSKLELSLGPLSSW